MRRITAHWASNHGLKNCQTVTHSGVWAKLHLYQHSSSSQGLVILYMTNCIIFIHVSRIFSVKCVTTKSSCHCARLRGWAPWASSRWQPTVPSNGQTLCCSTFNCSASFSSHLQAASMVLLRMKCKNSYWSIKKKLNGISPRANYTDRATAVYRRSDCQLFADKGCHVVSVTDPHGRILGFIDRSRYFSIK
jgi:hypothetical protein